MTGVITPQGIEDASGDPSATPLVQWAPAEPAPKKSRRALWIGLPVGIVAVAAVTASLVLIAPGTAVAGVPVGFLTAGAATDAISSRLAQTQITIGDGGATVTAADLGAAVDAEALAGAAFGQRPMWNVSQWFGDTAAAEVTLDAVAATAALQAAAPALYTAPLAATIAFDGDAYAVTPAVDGVGIDLETVRAALQEAFHAGQSTLTIDPLAVPVSSPTTTAMADGAAALLNGMLADIGFYVGDERTVPIDPDVAAAWLTVGTDETGAFTIDADAAQIQAVVDTLKDTIDQEVVDGTVVVNSAGDLLRTVTAGQDGRVLGDTAGVANAFADQLAAGDAVYSLPVEVTPQNTTELARLLEVDLSEQRLYLKENGRVVDTWLISSGRPGAVTYTGHYSIGWKTASQDMQGTARDSGNPYTQEDVPWVMYFNGNQAFHGAYWHNNFGNVMSAGCVNMPPALAKKIYDWSPSGTDVWIHS